MQSVHFNIEPELLNIETPYFNTDPELLMIGAAHFNTVLVLSHIQAVHFSVENYNLQFKTLISNQLFIISCVERYIEPYGQSNRKNYITMKNNWNILSNRFDKSTKRNYKKMLGMIIQHANALSAGSDPFIRSLFRDTDPVRESYCRAHAVWESAKGGRKGESLRFRKLMKVLYTEKIPQWEVNILIRFPEKSPEYKALFNGGRTAFRRGPYDLRLERLASLVKSLEDFPGLHVTRQEVVDFHRQLLKARTTNKGESTGVKDAAVRLEAERRAAAMRMYANLGFLMGHFAEDPAVVKRFFEVGKLRARRRKKTDLKTVKQKAA
jgi:hypothetical protein